MKKSNQQSRSGWGGKRAGAGAPYGNTNTVKHGERSRRAFFPLEGDESLTPLSGLRARNLLLAEALGMMRMEGRYFSGKPEDWREQMLLDGMMWQHTRRIMRLERLAARQGLALALSALSKAKRALRKARAEADGN
jgi:hypothetical protein